MAVKSVIVLDSTPLGLLFQKPGYPKADDCRCAQVLAAGIAPTDFVVATSNVSHLSLFVPAEPWRRIK